MQMNGGACYTSTIVNADFILTGGDYNLNDCHHRWPPAGRE
jgi:hypothetical protein